MYEHLLFDEESSTLDFKSEQYKFINEKEAYVKSKLLKDILAFANAWRKTDAYILIGVKEVKGNRSEVLGIDDKDHIDDASLRQFVNEKTQKEVNFEYIPHKLDNKNIAIIKIGENDRPIYLKKDYGDLKAEKVYVRKGSYTSIATPDEIYNMGVHKYKKSKGEPVLNIKFADTLKRELIGTETNLQATIFDLTETAIKSIPDYEGEGTTGMISSFTDFPNKNYYRSLIFHDIVKLRSNKIAFGVENMSENTATDIKIQIRSKMNGDIYNYIFCSDMPEIEEKCTNHLRQNISSVNIPNLLKGKIVDINKLEKDFLIELLFEKVQPKQIVFMNEPIILISNSSHQTTLFTKIFADNLSNPIEQELVINCQAEYKPNTFSSILKNHDIDIFKIYNRGTAPAF